MPAMYGLGPLLTGKSRDNDGQSNARLGEATRGGTGHGKMLVLQRLASGHSRVSGRSWRGRCGRRRDQAVLTPFPSCRWWGRRRKIVDSRIAVAFACATVLFVQHRVVNVLVLFRLVGFRVTARVRLAGYGGKSFCRTFFQQRIIPVLCAGFAGTGRRIASGTRRVLDLIIRVFLGDGRTEGWRCLLKQRVEISVLVMVFRHFSVELSDTPGGRTSNPTKN